MKTYRIFELEAMLQMAMPHILQNNMFEIAIQNLKM